MSLPPPPPGSSAALHPKMEDLAGHVHEDSTHDLMSMSRANSFHEATLDMHLDPPDDGFGDPDARLTPMKPAFGRSSTPLQQDHMPLDFDPHPSHHHQQHRHHHDASDVPPASAYVAEGGLMAETPQAATRALWGGGMTVSPVPNSAGGASRLQHHHSSGFGDAGFRALESAFPTVGTPHFLQHRTSSAYHIPNTLQSSRVSLFEALPNVFRMDDDDYLFDVCATCNNSGHTAATCPEGGTQQPKSPPMLPMDVSRSHAVPVPPAYHLGEPMMMQEVPAAARKRKGSIAASTSGSGSKVPKDKLVKSRSGKRKPKAEASSSSDDSGDDSLGSSSGQLNESSSNGAVRSGELAKESKSAKGKSGGQQQPHSSKPSSSTELARRPRGGRGDASVLDASRIYMPVNLRPRIEDLPDPDLLFRAYSASRNAQVDWLSPTDLWDLMEFAKTTGFASKSVLHPNPGCIFYFDSRTSESFRNDGYSWVKKRGSDCSVREDHVKLKVGGVARIYASYVHSSEFTNSETGASRFHRRSYWELSSDIASRGILVHYLGEKQSGTTPSVPVDIASCQPHVSDCECMACALEDINLEQRDALAQRLERHDEGGPESAAVPGPMTPTGLGSKETTSTSSPLRRGPQLQRLAPSPATRDGAAASAMEPASPLERKKKASKRRPAETVSTIRSKDEDAEDADSVSTPVTKHPSSSAPEWSANAQFMPSAPNQILYAAKDLAVVDVAPQTLCPGSSGVLVLTVASTVPWSSNVDAREAYKGSNRLPTVSLCLVPWMSTLSCLKMFVRFPGKLPCPVEFTSPLAGAICFRLPEVLEEDPEYADAAGSAPSGLLLYVGETLVRFVCVLPETLALPATLPITRSTSVPIDLDAQPSSGGTSSSLVAAAKGVKRKRERTSPLQRAVRPSVDFVAEDECLPSFALSAAAMPVATLGARGSVLGSTLHPDEAQELEGHELLAHSTEMLNRLVGLLLGSSPETIDVLTENGMSLLHETIFCNARLDVIRHILEKGGDPNLLTSRGDSCLHLAVDAGNEDVVALLLRFGADPNVVDAQGLTPARLAATSEDPRRNAMVRMLEAQVSAMVAPELRAPSRAPAMPRGGDESPRRFEKEEVKLQLLRDAIGQLSVQERVSLTMAVPPNAERRRSASMASPGLARGASPRPWPAASPPLLSLASDAMTLDSGMEEAAADSADAAGAAQEQPVNENDDVSMVVSETRSEVLEKFKDFTPGELTDVHNEVSKIQSNVRAWILRKNYVKMKNATTKLQAVAKGHLARRMANDMRKQVSATLVIHKSIHESEAAKQQQQQQHGTPTASPHRLPAPSSSTSPYFLDDDANDSTSEKPL